MRFSLPLLSLVATCGCDHTKADDEALHPYAGCVERGEADRGLDGTIDFTEVWTYDALERVVSYSSTQDEYVSTTTSEYEGDCLVSERTEESGGNLRYSAETLQRCDAHDSPIWTSYQGTSEYQDDVSGEWEIAYITSIEGTLENTYEADQLVEAVWDQGSDGVADTVQMMTWEGALRVTRSTDYGADGAVDLDEGWTYNEDERVTRYTREDWLYEQRYALDYTWDGARLLEVEQDYDIDGTPEYRTTYTWGEEHMSSALWDVMASDDQDVLWAFSVECP